MSNKQRARFLKQDVTYDTSLLDVTWLARDDAETLALPDDPESEPDTLSDTRPDAPPLSEPDTPTEISPPLLCAGPDGCVGGDVPVPVVEACRRVIGAYGVKN